MTDRLLVIGGSRGIGAQTARRALRAGYDVRILARNAGLFPDLGARLERFSGDATDAAAVSEAVADADAVVLALGIRRRDLLRPVTLFSRATRVLLEKLDGRDARLVAVTGFGAGDSARSIDLLQRAPFRLAFGRAYADKSDQERMIEASTTRWTIVRPSMLYNGSNTANYRVLIDPDTWRNGLISRADVADYIVRCLDDDSTIGAAPVLVGNTGIERIAFALSASPFGGRCLPGRRP